MTRDEAAFYTDLLPGGEARQFGVMMEAKSIVTRPSGGHHLPGPGFYEISGMPGPAVLSSRPWKCPPMAAKPGRTLCTSNPC